MAALDSRVALALMAKAEIVFGEPGKQLCFPIGAPSYTEDQLQFFAADGSAEAARRAALALFDFSTFSNAIPTGRIWTAASDASLPAAYRRVLEGAKLATLPPDPDALDRLHQARAKLVEVAADGAESDTPAFGAYKACRDAYILALQRFNSARSSGEFGDAADRGAWEAAQPGLQAGVDAAVSDWEVRGYKAEIDAALAEVSILTRKAPGAVWHDWDTRSSLGVGTVTSLAGSTFWPTYLSPANAASAGWQSMTLNQGEVAQLQDRAPPELRARLVQADDPLSVESLEFEYSSAKLQRPWFDPAALAARFWRPASGDLVVSTGAPPLEGICPLYASGVIFFRRIRATVRGQPEAVRAVLNATFDDNVDLGLFRFKKDLVNVAPRPRPQIADPMPSWSARRAELLGDGPLSMQRAVIRANLGVSDAALVADNVDLVTPTTFQMAHARTSRATFRDLRLFGDLSAVADVPPTMAPGPVSVIETGPTDIFILALICSVVPKSPDPDPELSWT